MKRQPGPLSVLALLLEAWTSPESFDLEQPTGAADPVSVHLHLALDREEAGSGQP